MKTAKPATATAAKLDPLLHALALPAPATKGAKRAPTWQSLDDWAMHLPPPATVAGTGSLIDPASMGSEIPPAQGGGPIEPAAVGAPGARRRDETRTASSGSAIEPASVKLSELPLALLSAAHHLSPQALKVLRQSDLLPVLIDAPDAGAAKKAVARLGGEARVITPTKLTARVPRANLAKIAGLAEVRYVGANTRLKLACDRAHRAARLIDPQSNRPLVAETGKGVLVGVVDTGIDAAHPAFQVGGRSRIVDYLDQITGQRHPGNPFVAIAAAAASPDMHGHGTHVAGIAAGNGAGSAGALYRGVAPEADLAIVKTTFDSTAIAEAVAHIFEVATERKQPCVVNLSLGSQYGPHDGSTPLERLIDNLCDERGRVVVIAAGNEGDARAHAHGLLAPNAAEPVRWVADLELFSQRAGNQLIGATWVQVWTHGEDDLTVGLRTPHGELVVPPAGNHARLDRGEIIVDAIHQVWSYTGDNSWTFGITAEAQTRLLTGWSIVVSENRKAPDRSGIRIGAVHAWCGDDTARFNANAVPSHLVGMPGTSFSAITVASYASRDAWESKTGPIRLNALHLDDISYFSSPGPTRDGLNKPEVAAPGQYVVSALSAAAADLPEWMRLGGDIPYVAMQGTSMASPYVAGAVALMLEKDPTLTWAEIKRRLIKSVTQDSLTRPCWNARWGYGRLDVQRLLA